jgi:hypothetical protein
MSSGENFRFVPYPGPDFTWQEVLHPIVFSILFLLTLLYIVCTMRIDTGIIVYVTLFGLLDVVVSSWLALVIADSKWFNQYVRDPDARLFVYRICVISCVITLAAITYLILSSILLAIILAVVGGGAVLNWLSGLFDSE